MMIVSLFIELCIFSIVLGTFLKHESNFIYEVDENYNTKKTNYYATFKFNHFDQGAFRYCYIGNVKNIDNQNSNQNFFPTGKCVVKVFKDRTYGELDIKNDLGNIFYSQKISKIFNSQNLSNKKLIFVDNYLASFKENAFIDFGKRTFNEDEWMIIEPYIEGKYEKFVSNNGWTKENIEKTIPLFMHWNWVYSKGEKLVSDIQGVKKDYIYELTDPAVQSIYREYGGTDLGIEGLIYFLSEHKHNELCQSLPWPNDEEIKKIKEAKRCLIKKRGTSYTFELKNCRDEEIKNLYKKVINSTFNNNFLSIIIIVVIIFAIVMIFFLMVGKKNIREKLD